MAEAVGVGGGTTAVLSTLAPYGVWIADGYDEPRCDVVVDGLYALYAGCGGLKVEDVVYGVED